MTWLWLAGITFTVAAAYLTWDAYRKLLEVERLIAEALARDAESAFLLDAARATHAAAVDRWLRPDTVVH